PPAVVKVVEPDRPKEPPPPRAGRFGVEVGGAAVLSPDGVGPALLPLVRFDWSLRPWLLAHATLAGLGTRPTVETAAGGARGGPDDGVVALRAPLPHRPTPGLCY